MIDHETLPSSKENCYNCIDSLARESLVEKESSKEPCSPTALRTSVSSEKEGINCNSTVSSRNNNGEPCDSPKIDMPMVSNSCNNVGTSSFCSAEEKFRQQQLEASRRENVLVMRLTTKEQEVQELLAQLEELRSGLTNGGQIKNTLLDPAVNMMFQRMKAELEQTKEKLEQSVQEFDAWKFTPDSATGKRLMAKCRMLIQENEDLGKITSSGRIAKLDGDLALSRKLFEELKNSHTVVNLGSLINIHFNCRSQRNDAVRVSSVSLPL